MTDVDIVYYTADWCGPCLQMRGIVDETHREVARALSKDGDGRLVSLVVVNVDEMPDLVSSRNVDRVPTIQVRSEGETIASFVGARPKIDLRTAILGALSR